MFALCLVHLCFSYMFISNHTDAAHQCTPLLHTYIDVGDTCSKINPETQTMCALVSLLGHIL